MKRHQIVTTLTLLVCITAIPFQGTTTGGENWPRFRGPGGAGISNQQGLPVKWSDDDYAWKTKLSGLGHSSPCVWDDHLFLTSASDDGRTRLLLDIDTHSGNIRWTKATPSKTHRKHTLRNSPET